MKTIVKSLLVALLGCLLGGVPGHAEGRGALPEQQAAVRQDSEPVRKLRALYRAQPDFQKTMDAAFAGLKAQPDGRPNPWQGKNFDDLCAFFNAWYTLLPINDSPETDELVYITRFSWFYYQNKAAQTIVGQEPGLGWTKEFVTARGRFMESRESTPTIGQWLADPGIRIEQYIVPEDGFPSFNAFFTRDFKPGARTIAGATDDAVLVAPTDCVMNMIEPLTPETRIKTKLQQALNVKELLNGSAYARFFEDGTAMSCFLLPATYHHYHAPVAGEVVESRDDVAGIYWGNPDFSGLFNDGNIGYGASYSIFERFRRGYFVFKTREFGHVAMVPVGLDTIGSVAFEEKFRHVTPEKRLPVSKGEKLGHFAYGGSLVILLFEKDVISAVKVQLGQQIGIMEQKKRG